MHKTPPLNGRPPYTKILATPMPSIEQICSRAGKALFASVGHNQDHLLSPKKESVHALRPTCKVHDRDNMMRRTFLTRMLFCDYSCYECILRLLPCMYNDVCNAEYGLQL